MPLTKKMTELKRTLKKVKDALKEDNSIQEILGEEISPEILDQYLDYVIQDLLDMASKLDIDKWELGRRVLPFLMVKIIGTEELDDTLEDEVEDTKKERVVH